MENDKLIKAIRNGDETTILDLYKQLKPEFIQWVNRAFKLPKSDALDFFQDAMIIFYQNIKQGKLTSLQSSVKSYVFAIAKYKIINSIKSKVKSQPMNVEVEQLRVENPLDQWEINPEAQNLIVKVLKSFGEPCYSILKSFYFNNLSLEEIAQNLNYKNANVVKTQKSRCIKELRKLLLGNFRPEDLY